LPAWALPLAYWLHMLATVAWVGNLLFETLALPPALGSSLTPAEHRRVLEAVRRRFQPLGWLSLGVLIVTGLVQMSAHPSYRGLLTVENAWSLAILAKHLVIAAMVAVAGYQTWFLQPAIDRSALRLPQGTATGSGKLGALQRLQRRWARLNLALSVVVLALTALARTS